MRSSGGNLLWLRRKAVTVWFLDRQAARTAEPTRPGGVSE